MSARRALISLRFCGRTRGNHRRTGTVTAAVAILATAVSTLSAAADTGTVLITPGVIDVVVIDDHLTSTPTTLRGPQAADSAAKALRTQTFAITDTGTYQVPPELAASWRSGDKVKVTLQPVARSATTPRRAAATRARAAVIGIQPRADRIRPQYRATATAAGEHQLTVLPVHWAEPDDQTSQTLGDLGQVSSEYWGAQSAGAIRLNVSVRDWSEIPAPDGCDPTAVFESALTANGLLEPTNPYEHIAIYTPRWADCSWAGLATIGGSRIWVNGYPLPDILSHEIGHNLGLGHANLSTCTDDATRVTLSANCAHTDYGDGADIMGYATTAPSGNLNVALADQLGLLKSVSPADGESLEAELAPLGQADELRAAKIRLNQGWIYLEYRPAVAPDTRLREWAGVQARYLPDAPYPQSFLLDLQPWLSKPFAATAAQEYAVWRIPGTDQAVSVGPATGANRIRVRLVRTDSDTTAPTAPVIATIPTSHSPTQVQWSASTDTGSGLAGYRLLTDNAPVAFAAPTTLSAEVPQGVTSLQVEAVDAAGNTARSAILQLNGEDSSAPTPPTLLAPTAPVVQASRTVSVTWGPGDDPETGIVGYRIEVGDSTSTVGADARSADVVVPANQLSHIRISALNGAGLESQPALLSVTHDDIAPPRPTQLTRTPGTSTVTWRPAADATGVAYLVSVDGGDATWTSRTSSPVTVPTGRHLWTVQAVDGAGNVSRPSSVTAFVDTSAPSTPRLWLGAVSRRPSGIATASVTWTAATDPDSWVTEYRVEVSSASGTTVRVLPGKTRRANVTIPKGGATVRVRAVNAGGTPGGTQALRIR